MDQPPDGTNPLLHDPRWTAVGSAIASLVAGGLVVWRELRGRIREGKRRQTEDAAKQQRAEQQRSEQAWDQASQLRGEYRDLLTKSQTREEALQRELDAKEELIGNLKMRLASMTIRYNSAARVLKSLAIDDWEDLPLFPETNGGSSHNPPKS